MAGKVRISDNWYKGMADKMDEMIFEKIGLSNLETLLVAVERFNKAMSEVAECESYQWALNEMNDETNEKYSNAFQKLSEAYNTIKNKK